MAHGQGGGTQGSGKSQCPATQPGNDAWRGLAAEARALLAFLADRDPTVYRRYDHWWDKDLPRRDVRVLTG
jgi:hypothetical protein